MSSGTTSPLGPSGPPTASPTNSYAPPGGPRRGAPSTSGREQLRIALLAYRGNPRSGGQGVYTRFLSRELARLGHRVTVFAGQPWPVVDHAGGVELVKVPSLDLYREPDPFRFPHPRELHTVIDLLEVSTVFSGGFPEPLTFSLRVRRLLSGRRGDFDVLHDNQCFGTGLLGLMEDGWPLIGTCHHPVTVDRIVDLAHAPTRWRELSLRRWYGFVSMQNRVARKVHRILTVSSTSRRDIVEQMGVLPQRIEVVPVGADHELFRPLPGVARVPGRIMTTASADVPMKGLAYLLEALAKLRTELPEAHLVVVGAARPASAASVAMARLGLEGAVTFRSGVTDAELVELYSQASAVAVPSLYEGFSLPAVEAMACEAPVVASAGGALPEVVGRDGVAALLVPPADVGALGAALGRVLSRGPGPGISPGDLGLRLGQAGRRRVLERFTWARCAAAVVEQYRSLIAEREGDTDFPFSPPGHWPRARSVVPGLRSSGKARSGEAHSGKEPSRKALPRGSPRAAIAPGECPGAGSRAC
jgi:glycosyltransferase involved in cell wall biosynthesis